MQKIKVRKEVKPELGIFFVILLGLNLNCWATGTAGGPVSSYKVQPDEKESVRRTFNAEARRAEGGWTGGGGEGLACFANAQVRERAFNDRQQLTPEGRNQIAKLYLLDAWEKSEKYRTLQPGATTNGAFRLLTPFEFIVRRLESLYPIAPYFIYRLQESVLHIRQRQLDQNWEDVRDLPKIEDSGPIQRQIPTECQRVQLAVRYSQSLANGARPRVFVDVDGDLLQKMRETNNPTDSVIFEAGLILHEALYMAAAELGAQNSAKIRDMTMYLLSFDLNNEMNRLQPHERLAAFANAFVTRGFQDIMKLFVPTVRSGIEPIDVERFRRAGRGLTAKHQQALQETSEQRSQPNLSLTESTEILMQVLAPRLTPLEAFLQVAYIQHNRNRLSDADEMNPLRLFIVEPEFDSRAIVQKNCSLIGVIHNLRMGNRSLASRTGDDRLARGYEQLVPAQQTLYDRALTFCLSEEYLSYDEIANPPR